MTARKVLMATKARTRKVHPLRSPMMKLQLTMLLSSAAAMVGSTLREISCEDYFYYVGEYRASMCGEGSGSACLASLWMKKAREAATESVRQLKARLSCWVVFPRSPVQSMMWSWRMNWGPDSYQHTGQY